MRPLSSGFTDPSPTLHGLDMTESRQRRIINVFVAMSNELVEDCDVVDVLAQLAAHCADLLDIASAGLLIADGRGALHLAASSSERTHHLEIFQLQRDEGPCLDCFHGGQEVLVPDLEAERHRWPQFARAASGVGFRSVHALPMRLSGNVLGAFGLFGDEPGALDTDDLELAQALLHLATVAIIDDRSATGRTSVNAQLQRALTSRIVVEQAKGALAQAGGLTIEAASTALQGYARDHGTKLSVVAGQIVGRELAYGSVLQHARLATGRH